MTVLFVSVSAFYWDRTELEQRTLDKRDINYA